MIEVMVAGAFGAQACQAANSLRGLRLRQLPGYAEHPRGLQRKHAERELGRNAKAAATAPAARPVQIGLGIRVGLQRLRLRIDRS